jgi:hypothetical protein
MKKLTISLLTLFLIIVAAASGYAAVSPGGSYEVDGSLAFATGPGDFDDGWGLSFGAGYMMKDIENLQARVDLSYFSFERDVFGTNVEYTRVPIAAGGRYYFPMMDKLNLYAEGAVELSFDDSEVVLLGQKVSDSEVNIGFTPGVGAEYFLDDAVSLFAAGRFHLISDNYTSVHFGGAYHF